MAKPAPLPADEKERLEALYAYELLDTVEEREFDRITDLAAQFFNAPIVLVSLVDRCRQWFKSHYGLEAEETHRDLAFCAYAILGEDVFYVEDASKDERFQGSPLVDGPPHIRTYVGAPLKTRSGFRLGTLCLIYDKVTPVSEAQKARLEQLAAMTMDAIELRLANRRKSRLLDEAHILNENKNRFVAMVSHELRTPMNGVCSMLEILSQSELDPHQSEYVQIAKDSSYVLLEIINDILDYSKLTAGKMQLDEVPCNPTEITRRTCDILHVEAENKNIEIHADIDKKIPETVKVDPVRLRQVLVNLLGNAIKFSEGNDVTLKLSALQEQGAYTGLKFKVMDRGLGIDPSALPKLFECFEQENNSVTRAFGGTGLGLSICRDLVHLMGGEIGAQSEKGQGSTFWFTLPAKECEKRSLAVQGKDTVASFKDRLHVLMVEDNIINQKVISLVLSPYNIEFVIANDGVEALRILAETHNFDLVLMDIEMPEMDGVATTQVIREDGARYGDMPIVAMTANMMDGDREKYLQVGMDGYISKPIDQNEALKVITAALKNADKNV